MLWPRWWNIKAERSTSGETGETDWAIEPTVDELVIVQVAEAFLLDDFDDLLGRFNEENGLGGILLDDLGNVPVSVGVETAVGDVAVFPALNDFRLNKLVRKAGFLLPLLPGVGVTTVGVAGAVDCADSLSV